MMGRPRMIRSHQWHNDVVQLLFSDDANKRSDPLL